MFEFTKSIFFWTLINFGILLFLVHKFALPSFYKMVDEHQNRKQKALDELNARNSEAERILKEYEIKLATAQEEAKKIIHQAGKDKKALGKKELKNLQKKKQFLISGLKDEVK